MSEQSRARPYEAGQLCPVCEQGRLQLVERPQEFLYKGHRRELPLQRVECPTCDEDFVDHTAAQAVEPSLRRWRREVDGLLMPEEIQAIRRGLGVTQRQMADIIGGGLKAFARYESGVVNQSKAVDGLLRTIKRHPDTLSRLARERGIELGLEPMELLLVWKNPKTRLRHVIGKLSRDRAGYHFRYETRLPRSLADARAEGFRLLDAFPAAEEHYRSPALFVTFARRLPASAGEYERLDLRPEQDLEFLRRTGGRLPDDTLEFLEPIKEKEVGDEYTVTFPIAGWRYYNGEAAVADLSEGTRLELKVEPENQHDPRAVVVLSPAGEKLGYVPAIYVWYVDASVEAGDYVATVHRVGPPEDPQGRVVVTLQARLSAPRPLKVPSVVQYAELLTV